MVNGNDVLEHIESCDSCMKLDEEIYEYNQNIKFLEKLIEELKKKKDNLYDSQLNCFEGSFQD